MTRFRYLALSFALVLSATPARAGDREFREIVDRLSDAYHKRPMRGMGFVSFVARFAHPEGVAGLRMAIFDDLDPSVGSGAPDLDRFLQQTLGPDFRPFVRVRSNRDNDQTYIYTREGKGDWDMLLLVVEPTESVLMKMRLKPDAMKRWVDDPREQGRGHHGGIVSFNWDD